MNSQRRLILSILVCVFVGLLALIPVILSINKEAKPLPPAELQHEVRQEILEAFRDPKTKVEVPGGIKEFFERTGGALQAGQSDASQYFDFDRFAEEINRNGILDRLKFGSRFPEGYREFKKMLVLKMAVAFKDIAWDSTEFRGLKWVRPQQEAVVITRHSALLNGDEVLFRMRWWLIRRPDGWRIYDFEDISIGLRITPLFSMMFDALATNPDQAGKTVQFGSKLQLGKQALLEQKFEQAEELFSGAIPAFLPSNVRAIVFVFRSLAKSGQGKAAESLADAELAEKLNRDVPIVDLIKAIAYDQLEMYEQAIASARKYMDLVGADENALWHLGHALEQTHRTDEAREAYSKSLDEQPTNLDVISSLRRCLDADQKFEFVERVMKLPKPEESFLRFVDESFVDMDFEAAEALIGAYRKRFPKKGEGTYQLARLKFRLHQEAEAKLLFLKAIADSTAPEHDRYLDGYLFEMLDKKESLEAYGSVADVDANRAFRRLAEAYQDRDEDETPESAKLLKDLIAVHRKRHPDDVWLVYFTAENQVRNKQFEEAEKALAGAMTEKLDEAEKARFRSLHISALYGGGKGLLAYQRLGKDAFSQLAHSYSSDDNVEGLADLLKAHRQVEPGDLVLYFWQGKLHWLKKEYAEAVKFLRLFREKEKDDKHYLQWQIDDMLVRSLIRLKRFEEARKLFEQNPKDFEYSLLPAAVAAVSGNLPKTEALLDEMAKKMFDVVRFYADPDLGPSLRSMPFAKLREKYPPPKEDRPLKMT